MLVRVVLVLACLVPSFAVAQPSRSYIGYSGTSCGTWIAERKKEPIHALGMEAWALGVVSGSNWSSEGKDRLKGLDANAIWSWLDNQCGKSPLMSFPDAVFTLARELARR